MTIKEYKNLRKRTENENLSKIDHQMNAFLGLRGELGEIIDIIKKEKYQGHDDFQDNKNKIIDESSDLLWYLFYYIEYNPYNIDIDDVIFYDSKRLNLDVSGLALSLSDYITYLDIEVFFHEKIIYMILTVLNEILKRYCSNIYEAMEYNIEKLKKRYPDKFEAEKSINRTI